MKKVVYFIQGQQVLKNMEVENIPSLGDLVFIVFNNYPIKFKVINRILNHCDTVVNDMEKDMYYIELAFA